MVRSCRRRSGPAVRVATRSRPATLRRRLTRTRAKGPTTAARRSSSGQRRPRGRGSPGHCGLAGVWDDDPFGIAICPHVELRDIETVDAQRRADLGAMVAPVMRELRYEDPRFELDVARVHAPVRVEVLLGEQALDAVAHRRQMLLELVESGCVRFFDARLGEDAETLEVTFVRPHDVREHPADRSVGAWDREV